MDTDNSVDAESENEPAPDPDRIYCVGSVSKVYVTTAVMQLVEQGKVDLDAPVYMGYILIRISLSPLTGCSLLPERLQKENWMSRY